MLTSMLKTTGVCLILLTSGCSAVGGLAADVAKDAVLGGPDKGLEVNANVGQAKTEGEENVAQQANTAVTLQSKKAQTYESPVETVVNEAGLQWWELGIIILLAGWAIPSPAEMLRGLIELFRLGRGTSFQGRS